jgi:hypothetical protein
MIFSLAHRRTPICLPLIAFSLIALLQNAQSHNIIPKFTDRIFQWNEIIDVLRMDWKWGPVTHINTLLFAYSYSRQGDAIPAKSPCFPIHLTIICIDIIDLRDNLLKSYRVPHVCEIQGSLVSTVSTRVLLFRLRSFALPGIGNHLKHFPRIIIGTIELRDERTASAFKFVG